MTTKSIKLLLVKPDTHMVKIRPQESLQVQIKTIGRNVDPCFISIHYDVDYLKLTEGAEVTSLGEGSFTKNLSWILESLKSTSNSLFVKITAEANSLFQTVEFNLRIIE